MMGHKICLFGEIWKIISKLCLLLLIWSTGLPVFMHIMLSLSAGRAGVIGGARPKTVQQVPAKTVAIYSDENSDPTLIQPQTGEWTKAPHRNQINKENEKKPGVWTKAKV